MASAASVNPIVQNNMHAHNPPSKCKTFGFALAIILGIEAIAIAFSSLGLHQGWWSVGALTNLSQIHLMVAIGVGIGGGIAALAVGIAGCVKNCRNNRHPDSPPLDQSMPLLNDEDEIQSPSGGCIYGRKEWEEKLNTRIPERVPPPPVFHSWDEKDPVFEELIKKVFRLVYIPKNLTFNMFDQSSGMQLICDEAVKRKYGDCATQGGWVLVSRKPATNMVKAQGIYRKPHIIEVLALVALEAQVKKKKIFNVERKDIPCTLFTQCSEKVDGNPVIVGKFNGTSIEIRVGERDVKGEFKIDTKPSAWCGIAPVRVI